MWNPQTALAPTLRIAVGILSTLLLIFYFLALAVVLSWEPRFVARSATFRKPRSRLNAIWRSLANSDKGVFLTILNLQRSCVITLIVLAASQILFAQEKPKVFFSDDFRLESSPPAYLWFYDQKGLLDKVHGVDGEFVEIVGSGVNLCCWLQSLARDFTS